MLVQILFKARPVLLNLLFIAYLWLLQPGLVARLNASQDGRGDWAMGGLLLVIPLLEIAGILLKRPVRAYFSRHYPRQDGSNFLIAAYILTAIFHLSLGAFLLIVAFQVGGGMPTGSLPGSLQCLMLVLLFVTIAKEGLVIATSYPVESKPFGAGAFPESRSALNDALMRFLTVRAPEQITLKIFLVDLLGDLLLLAFSAVVYTALWEFGTQGSQVSPGQAGFADYLGLTFYFLLVFLPLRMVSLMDEMASRAQRILSAASLAAVWLAAMLQVR
jgi:hypothetical protein